MIVVIVYSDQTFEHVGLGHESVRIHCRYPDQTFEQNIQKYATHSEYDTSQIFPVMMIFHLKF